MRILAVETSGPTGSLALGEFQDGNLLRVVSRDWQKKAIHSEVVTVVLGDLLKAAGISVRDIQKIAVNVGPGSFTGVRVGLNLARTLAYSLAIPITPLSTLGLLASRKAAAVGSTFVAIRAIQNFFYCAGFDHRINGLVERQDPVSLSEDQLATASQGFDRVLIEDQSPEFDIRLSAEDGLQFLQPQIEDWTFVSWKEVRPIYVRGSEAEEKLLKGLLKREVR
ncbi:MAG: tRNA (adenosine(37)-N6)-threonylcarbamoyltransferase complex dimerization subunit type 1 TsaB [Bdellovibrionales bacterium]